jgi:hypothetical protein
MAVLGETIAEKPDFTGFLEVERVMGIEPT